MRIFYGTTLVALFIIVVVTMFTAQAVKADTLDLPRAQEPESLFTLIHLFECVDPVTSETLDDFFDSYPTLVMEFDINRRYLTDEETVPRAWMFLSEARNEFAIVVLYGDIFCSLVQGHNVGINRDIIKLLQFPES